ncbi:cytochrome c oxidase assembly protein [Enterovirga aerilata]|uniref:Cytochrome c oxidase assembly protein CtaG n=1 Tax=Enterovirga aerilata TaxID=2730920 RepID=A0A849I6H9_9HYPH|nr:cytochrome c oxidase assembly protein [Enterovirga sp. DB1703]NNM72988.1 cytochrome c oxidase assembly protein [Enterovirga sp. DB1703]
MSPQEREEREKRIARGIRNTGLACLGLAVAMVGAAFAAVPLYDLFCRVTGFDGTPLVGTEAPTETLNRRMTVRFDTNVAPGLGWSFRPEIPQVEARLGETRTVFFKVKNEGQRASTGVATYNVQPAQLGAHFVKLKCFCFDEQTLQPGETMDFPVVFYVDPGIAKDRNLDDMSSVTLSYTYFASRNGQPLASADQGGAKPKL